jgi:hypothetical protein
MERFYFEEHMKFLMDKLAEAYIQHSFKEFDRIKKQIVQLRDVMNAQEVTLKLQIPKILEG